MFKLALTAALCWLGCNVALRSATISSALLAKRLQSAPYSNQQRELLIRHWFMEAGCAGKDLTQEQVSRGQPPNLICRLNGASNSLIIVGGHMDHVRRGMGVVDDWSGSSMLPALYQTLRARKLKHTFLFIGFTEEEKGLVGSRFYVRHMPESENREIKAMVNLECLGLAPPEVWSDHANPKLLSGLFLVARRIQIPLRGVDLERIGRDDAMSFRHVDLPTITIHSLTQSTIHVMHTPRDTYAAVHLGWYVESYRLVAAYLAYLDRTLPD